MRYCIAKTKKYVEFYAMNFHRKIRQKTANATDERVKLMRETISGIRVVKARMLNVAK